MQIKSRGPPASQHPSIPASQPFAPGRLAPLQSWADGDGGGADRIPIRVAAAFAGKTPIEEYEYLQSTRVLEDFVSYESASSVS